MSAVWMRARAELRARWRATIVLALTVGLLAGAAIAAAAGARRTESAYPRFVERYGVYDVSVGMGEVPDAQRALDQIQAIPMVEATSRSALFFARVRAPSGAELAFPEVFVIAERSSSGPDLAQFKVVEGRLYDASATDEVALNYALAERMGVQVGDRLQVSFVEAFGGDGVAREVSVVGIVAAVGGFETLNGSGFPAVIGAGPAYFDAYRRFTPDTDANIAVRLRDREQAIPAFREELQRRGIPFDTVTRFSSFTPDVLELNRVPSIALWALSVLLGVAAVALTGQAVARETAVAGADADALRALGFARGDILGVATVRNAVVAGLGAAAAAAVAVGASPLAPLGVARVAEPDPGTAFDAAAIGIGALATFLLTVIAGFAPAWRLGRAGRSVRVRSGRLSALAAPAPPALATGLRLALEPGRDRRAVPVQEAVVGMALAIAAVTTATVFDESLGRLLEDHTLSGYQWDAAAVGFVPDSLDAIEAELPDDLVADSWRGTVFSGAEIDGLAIDLVTGDRPMHSVLDGRAPATATEIILDRATVAELGKGIGDTVVVRGRADEQPFEVVGTFVVQRLPFQPERPGQGAGVTPDAFRRLEGELVYEGVYVRFTHGVDPAAGARELRAAVGDHAFAVLSPQQSGGTSNLGRISDVPLALTGVFGIVGVATLIHALSMTLGRRKRELAVLRTLGFVRRQLRVAVGTQCLLLVGIALAVGIPAGAILGRWGWRMFANQIGVVPAPVWSGDLLGTVPMVLLLAALIAVPHARAAARTKPALVLRSE